MKKFFVITNANKDTGLKVTKRIQEYLEKHGATCETFMDNLSDNDSKAQLLIPRDTDCILVLGGDGTMLQAARENLNTDIPMIGINMGTKGYLTEIEVSSLEDALEHLLSGEYHMESRMMLSGVICKSGKELQPMCALNEVAITRKGSLEVIYYNVYVNGKLLKVYSGDGIMVSTPTGSTGYNLSAGGPIIEPGASILALTPINAHNLNSKGIILKADDVIEVEMVARRGIEDEAAYVSCDGDRTAKLLVGDRFVVERANHTIKICKVNKQSFLETMRKKMR